MLNSIQDIIQDETNDAAGKDFQVAIDCRHKFWVKAVIELPAASCGGIKPYSFRIALQMIRVIRVICEICGLK